MRAVKIYRAIGDEIEPVTITIDAVLPLLDTPDWEKRTKAMHDADAANLYQALAKSLPGGTLHRLHAVMVMHYAGLYARPSEMREDKP